MPLTKKTIPDNPFCTNKPPADGLPWFINLNITNRCNLHCRMCQMAASKVENAPLEKVLRFIDRLADWLPTPREALISGGEPLTHPHLIEIVERIASRGFVPAMNTNAAALNIRTVHRLIDAGLAKIKISLDGIGPVHDELRNGPGLFGGVMDMIHYLSVHTDIDIVTSSVISAFNAHVLPDLVRRLAENKRIGAIHFQAVTPILAFPWDDGFFKTDPLWPVSKEELDKVLACLDELESLRRSGAPINNPEPQFAFWRRYFSDPQNFLTGQPCEIAQGSFQMHADGTISFCDHLGRLGTIDDPPEELWTSETAQTMREKMRRCPRPCNYRINCCYLLPVENCD